MTTDRKPFHVRCTNPRFGDFDPVPECGHVWIVAYLPMEATTFANNLMNAHCPACGCHDEIHVATDEQVRAATGEST